MPVRARVTAVRNAGKSNDDDNHSHSAAASPQAPYDSSAAGKERKCCGASGGGHDANDELVLRVHVIGAKNLAPKDDPEDKTQSDWGLSDPFAVVHCGTESITTEWKEKELSPTWDTVLEFTKFEPDTCFREFYALKEDGARDLVRESALRIEVFDHDDGQFESDELIGTVQLPFPHDLWAKMHEEPAQVAVGPDGRGRRLVHPCYGWEEEWLPLEQRNPVTEKMDPVFFQEQEFAKNPHKRANDEDTVIKAFGPLKHPPPEHLISQKERMRWLSEQPLRHPEVGERVFVGLEPRADIDGDGEADAWGHGARSRICEVMDVDKHNQRFLVRYDEKMVKRECWGPYGTGEDERPGSPMLALQLTDPDAEGEFVGVILVQCLVIHQREITRRQNAKRAAMDIQRQIKVKNKRRKATSQQRLGRSSSMR